MRTRWAALAATAALLAACGSGAEQGSGQGAGSTPEVAWTEPDGLHVVRGTAERVVEGYEPFWWTPDGDLVAHTPADSSGMSVIRPTTGETVVETDDEWSRERYGGEEFGLDSDPGRTTAPDAILRLEDDREGEGALSTTTLVTYDLELDETDSLRLPDADDREQMVRSYDTPVRVGDVTLVPFFELAAQEEIDTYADTAANGVLRIVGDDVTTVAAGEHVNQLFLSADHTTVLGVATAEGQRASAEGSGVPGTHLVELDPASGEVVRDLEFPDVFDADDYWSVERVDAVGGDVAVQLATECAGADDGCAALTTWRHDGSGWSEIVEQRGRDTYWQGPDTRVEWTVPGGEETDGPITVTTGDETTELGPADAVRRVASGGLLPPTAR